MSTVGEINDKDNTQTNGQLVPSIESIAGESVTSG